MWIRQGLAVGLFAAIGTFGFDTVHASKSAAGSRFEDSVSAWVEAIRHADYRGDRTELARLVQATPQNPPPALAAFVDYWKGFASWRRAFNGFNETPFPADLQPDLEAAITSCRQAIAHDPGFVDAHTAVASCIMSLLYFSGKDADRIARLVEELRPEFQVISAHGADNPRALWVMGASQLSSPPPYGGDAAKAAATFQRGLEAARREANQSTSPGAPPTPAWIPTWGAPELLMNLAYLHAQGPTPNRALARAYAEGALASAPDWHYVRDILLPQIDALPLR